jgi:hypothetical protein
MRTRALAGSLLIILSLLLTQPAYSTFTIGTIDVDFNGGVTPSASATGAAAIGSVGDVWNILSGTPSGAQALNLVTGVASSGVTLSLSGTFITGTPGGANGPNAALTQDFLATGTNGNSTKTGTITLAGLTPSQSYAIYLYNGNGSTSVGRITDFSVVGTSTVTGSINNVGTPGTVMWTPATAVIPGNYLQLNATANVSGQLVINFMNRAAMMGSEGDLAGFQIRAIPEPSTYAMVVTGAAALLIVGYRTRRRASAK